MRVTQHSFQTISAQPRLRVTKMHAHLAWVAIHVPRSKPQTACAINHALYNREPHGLLQRPGQNP